jgi:hypothetical protein
MTTAQNLPIITEHPLREGDVVKHSRTGETASITAVQEDGWVEATFPIGIGRWWHGTKGHSEYAEPGLYITRIADTPLLTPSEISTPNK